jgi:outer membrane protein TolC
VASCVSQFFWPAALQQLTGLQDAAQLDEPISNRIRRLSRASPLQFLPGQDLLTPPRHVLSLRRQVERSRHIVGFQISPDTGRADV